MKLRLYRLLTFLILSSLLMACAGAVSEEMHAQAPYINPPAQLPASQDAFPQINERHPQVEQAYSPVAENDLLRLYIKEASSAIIVEDKRSGVLWRSSPVDLQEDKATSNIWKRQIEVPIQVSFVDAERSQPKNVKPEQIVQEYSPVKAGVKVAYTFPNDNLALDLYFTLQDDCLNVFLPSGSIVEDGKNSLVSIEMLPFFGATHDGEEGYIVYPDGSGALMYFTSPHPSEVQKIAGIIYGADASGAQAASTTGSGIFRQPLPMPVFGLVRGEAGFASIITQGDFDSGVSLGRAGKGVNYNHVWSQFVYRRQGRFSLTGGQPTWLYQPDRIPGDRQVRYCFLNGDEANYAGIAQRYRQFLMDERGARRVAQQPPLMYLGLFMGTERRNWILRDMIAVTTFSQASEILADLASQGVTNLDVALWNWDEGSISIRNPQHFPVDKRLGGEEGLTALARDIHQHGQRLYLYADFLTISPDAKGVFPYLDAVRGVDGLPLGSGETGYLLNPQIALERYVGKEIEKMQTLGVDGLLLANFASTALPDKNSRYPMTREGFAATWMKIANLSLERLGAVMMTGSNIYAAPYSNALLGSPLDSTHYDIFDETIPLLPIAVHGLVQYTGQPFNLISDNQRMYLRQIEYGASPLFILTKESSSKLVRTPANDLYSSQYSYWKDEVIQQYKTMESLASLQAQFIVGHDKLAEGVYQTTYEDGTKIIVNYTATEYASETGSIPPKDFIVVKGQ